MLRYLIVINVIFAFTVITSVSLSMWAWHSHDGLITGLVGVIGAAIVVLQLLAGMIPAMICVKTHPLLRRYWLTTIVLFTLTNLCWLSSQLFPYLEHRRVLVIDVAGNPIIGASVESVAPSFPGATVVTDLSGMVNAPETYRGGWLVVRAGGCSERWVVVPSRFPITVVMSSDHPITRQQ